MFDFGKLIECFLNRFNTKNSKGNCVVCQYECKTKSCKCSFLHQECAKEIIKARGNICDICQTKYNIKWLQKCPSETEEEKKILIRQSRNLKIKTRQLNHSIKKKFRILIPHILKLYPILRKTKKINIKILLEDIRQSHLNSIYQSLLNVGFKDFEANELIKFLIYIEESLEILQKSSMKTLNRTIKQSIITSTQ